MKTEEKELTVNELATIESQITVFRACPAISFTQANNINSNHSIVKVLIKDHEDQMSLIKERAEGIQDLKDTNKEEYEKQVIESNKEVVALFKKKHTVKLNVLSMSEFSELKIDGDKEVKQQDGSITKFSYRDAFFTLVEYGIIA